VSTGTWRAKLGIGKCGLLRIYNFLKIDGEIIRGLNRVVKAVY